jgi:hypothetical protein
MTRQFPRKSTRPANGTSSGEEASLGFEQKSRATPTGKDNQIKTGKFFELQLKHLARNKTIRTA